MLPCNADERNHLNRAIELRGGREHNLKSIDVDIPLGKLIAICGVSGSGKTSLALDTFHAEGQRRFVECFSVYARQFLQRWSQPALDRLDHLPPSIAVAKRQHLGNPRHTVGTVTECADYLRLIYAKCAQLFCLECGTKVQSHSASSTAAWLAAEGPQVDATLVASLRWDSMADLSAQLAELQAAGFVRLMIGTRTWHLARDDRQQLAQDVAEAGQGWLAIDRFKGGPPSSRTIDSLETAFGLSDRDVALLIQLPNDLESITEPIQVFDDRRYRVEWLPRRRVCLRCSLEYPEPEPALFSFNSPLGACPTCEGAGEVWADAKKRQRQICGDCQGRRLQPQALAYQLEGRSMADFLSLHVDQALPMIQAWSNTLASASGLHEPLRQIENRLAFMQEVGLSYLTLQRPMRSLSRGESQRVALTTVLGSDLTNMLYVLDEPTTGLHPTEVVPLIRAIKRLRDRGNTVLVVEHDLELLQQADWLLELGPKSGDEGGELIFAGKPTLLANAGTSTGKRLKLVMEQATLQAGNEPEVPNTRSKPPQIRSRGRVNAPGRAIHLRHATGNNLQGIDVTFPLGVLCVVTGLSGSGKSSLVVDTLYPALCQQLGQTSETPLGFQSISGANLIGEVNLSGQSAPLPSTRGFPVTLMKALDAIRQIFAETTESRLRNWTSSHFSFHHALGRCEQCEGSGQQVVDMQFLADMTMVCSHCEGSRYRPEILEVKFRDRSIADILAMTSQEGLAFFRGYPTLQKKCEALCEAGLSSIRLGQPVGTLSDGEMQRLKLAAQWNGNSRANTLFLMDEPTCGLHGDDVDRLIENFHRLLEAGHSLIVIEHDEQIIRAADYLIELGPGAADMGGRLIACGSPSEFSKLPSSPTRAILYGS